jgi:hypothetical protein
VASLDGFSKDYYADQLIDQGVIIECKTARALCDSHRGQTLNYLFLCGLHHGTLLNFRTERVEHEFVSTRLTPDRRHRYELVLLEWKSLTPRCVEMRELMGRMLGEWGAFLDPSL